MGGSVLAIITIAIVIERLLSRLSRFSHSYTRTDASHIQVNSMSYVLPNQL